MSEEFNERFETVEAALKYIADSQAKTEFTRKREKVEFDKQIEKIVKLQEHTQKQIDQTQKQLNHITKVVRFLVEEDEFQEEKLQAAGEILSRKNPKKG